MRSKNAATYLARGDRDPGKDGHAGVGQRGVRERGRQRRQFDQYGGPQPDGGLPPGADREVPGRAVNKGSMSGSISRPKTSELLP